MASLQSKYSQIYLDLAIRLRQAREEAGLTQTQAATSLGKPQSFVSKCEIGQRRIDFIELKAFASLYGKDLNFFDVHSQ